MTASRVLLTDFGLAKNCATGSRYTRTGEALGTPAYMSPEQARGEAALTPASDVWALGCVGYELLTGRAAFGGGSAAEIVGQVLTTTPLAPRRLRRDLPRAVDRLVRAALARPATARPPNAAALRDDCGRILAGLRGVWHPAGRLRGPALAAVALLAIGGAGAWLAPGLRTGPPGGARADHGPAELAAAAAALRSIDPARAAEQLRRALADAPHRHDWRIERGLLCWAVGLDAEALAEWDSVPTDAAEGARARLYEGLQRFFGAAGSGEGLAAEDLRPLEDAARVPAWPGRVAIATLAAAERRWTEARSALAGIEGWEAVAVRAYVEQGADDGDLVAAARGLGQVIEMGLPFSWAHAIRGSALLKLRDAAGAREAFDAALRLAPDTVRYLRGRSIARDRAGDAPGARDDLEAACRLAPDDPEMLASLADHLRTHADAGAAERLLSEALERLPREARLWRARAALRTDTLGDHRGALADLDRALALEPEAVEALQHRAVARRRVGDIRGALADVDRALAKRPGDVEARILRGHCGMELGAVDDAEQDFRVALDRHPDHPEALSGIGNVRLARGDLAGALRAFDESLALRPEAGHVWRNRANTRLRLGDPAGARADLEEGLRRGGDDLACLVNHGAILRNHFGDLTGAEADLRRAVELAPETVIAWLNLGDILEAQGRLREAAVAYRECLQRSPAGPLAATARARLARVAPTPRPGD